MTDRGYVALLTRKSDITQAQFLDHWLNNHAPLVIPWALARGCTSYVQYHHIRLSAACKAGDPALAANLEISQFDGAAEMLFDQPPPAKLQEKLNGYFTKVVVPDELKFLAGPSYEIARLVDERLIEATKIVLVKDGKIATGPDGKDLINIEETGKFWEDWSSEGME